MFLCVSSSFRSFPIVPCPVSILPVMEFRLSAVVLSFAVTSSMFETVDFTPARFSSSIRSTRATVSNNWAESARRFASMASTLPRFASARSRRDSARRPRLSTIRFSLSSPFGPPKEPAIALEKGSIRKAWGRRVARAQLDVLVAEHAEGSHLRDRALVELDARVESEVGQRGAVRPEGDAVHLADAHARDPHGGLVVEARHVLKVRVCGVRPRLLPEMDVLDLQDEDAQGEENDDEERSDFRGGRHAVSLMDAPRRTQPPGAVRARSPEARARCLRSRRPRRADPSTVRIPSGSCPRESFLPRAVPRGPRLRRRP